MKKVLSILSIAFFSIIVLSCNKNTLGDPEACMNLGDTQFGGGNVAYIMNCSKNYNLVRWRIFDNQNNEIYLSPTDTSKHLSYPFTSGNYTIDLRVWQSLDTTKSATITETVSVP